MAAEQPRKHHYLPQFYLKGFADRANRVSQLFKKNLRIVVPNVRDAGAEHDFHTIDAETADKYLFEKTVSQVEAVHAPTLKALLDRPSDLKHHVNGLTELALFMFHRAPKTKEMIQASASTALRASMIVMEKAGKFGDMPDSLRASLKGKRLSDVANPVPKNWFLIDQMLQLGTDPQLFTLMLNMNASLLIARGPQSFVVGDAAVVLFDKAYGRNPMAGGFSSPTIEITLPLSSRMMAVFKPQGRIGVFNASDALVRMMNQRSIIWAEKFVFTDVFDSKTLSDVVKIEKQSAGYSVENTEAHDGVYTRIKTSPVHPSQLFL